MRRELRCAAVVLVISLSPFLFAATPPETPKAGPAEGAGAISTALCGRVDGSNATLAKALDDPSGPAWSWWEVEEGQLEVWLSAPICTDASEAEADLYRSRRVVLDRLGRLLERATLSEQIGPALTRFRGWRPSAVAWPASAECDGCAVLRLAADRVAGIASRWPARANSKSTARLREAAKREPLVKELCAAKPPPGARAEIEREFRYYSWTSSAAELFEIAAWFEQPEVAAGCEGR